MIGLYCDNLPKMEPIMISAAFIDRTLAIGDHDRLLRELAHNGLTLPLPLRAHLSDSPVGAIALGLRRLAELTYGPTPLIRELTETLIHELADGRGIADSTGQACPVLTAAAALGRLLRDHAGRLSDSQPAIETARHAAIAALSAMQRPDGLFQGAVDLGQDQRLMNSAFVADLLAEDEVFGTLCYRHTLLCALEEARDNCSTTTAPLIDMALRGHPQAPTPHALFHNQATLCAA